jgi:hypothetical protein
MEAARKPEDPRLAELVGDLSIRDAQCRQWWAGTHVAAKRRGTRRYSQTANKLSIGVRNRAMPVGRRLTPHLLDPDAGHDFPRRRGPAAVRETTAAAPKLPAQQPNHPRRPPTRFIGTGNTSDASDC